MRGYHRHSVMAFAIYWITCNRITCFASSYKSGNTTKMLRKNGNTKKLKREKTHAESPPEKKRIQFSILYILHFSDVSSISICKAKPKYLAKIAQRNIFRMFRF